MNSEPNLQRYFYPDGVRESRMSGGRKAAARGNREPGASFIHAPGPLAPWPKAIPCTAEPGRQPHASETASQPADSLTALGTAPCPQSLHPRAAKEARMDFRKKVHERERQSCQSNTLPTMGTPNGPAKWLSARQTALFVRCGMESKTIS